jgi:hypothetical protein
MIERSKPFMDDYLPQDAPDVSPIADALLSQPHFGGTPKKILPIIVTVDELPPSDYPKPYNPQHVVDGVVVEDVDDDDPEDDGQPSEYEEWQDYMGGDDWDHGQYDDCGW